MSDDRYPHPSLMTRPLRRNADRGPLLPRIERAPVGIIRPHVARRGTVGGRTELTVADSRGLGGGARGAEVTQLWSPTERIRRKWHHDVGGRLGLPSIDVTIGGSQDLVTALRGLGGDIVEIV